MRRPAQHRLGPTPAPGWAHPYAGLAGLAVFYNSGADPAAPPAPAVEPPKPGPPPTPAATFTQEDIERIAAKEKSQGERAGARKALEDLAKEMGFTNPDDVKAFVSAARQAEEAKKTEEQKRQEELDRREQELSAKEAAATARERAAIRKAAVMGLGATGDDLADALAILERDLADNPDADETAVTRAAEALKERRPALFGSAPTPPAGQLPPAPGGAPAGGPPPRQAPAGKPGDRGREMARRRGHVRDNAA